MSGRFIVLEGIDGSGKGTQLALLAERLTNAGHSVWLTREPTDGAIGSRCFLLPTGSHTSRRSVSISPLARSCSVTVMCSRRWLTTARR